MTKSEDGVGNRPSWVQYSIVDGNPTGLVHGMDVEGVLMLAKDTQNRGQCDGHYLKSVQKINPF